MEAAKGRNAGRNNPVIYRDQLVTVEFFEIFKEELLGRMKSLLTSASALPEKKWLKSIDVRKMLGISPGTLQNLRVNGTLPFTKIGGVLYYDGEDIQRVMSSNRKHHQTGRQDNQVPIQGE
jgi:hypothetical protein